MMKTRTSLTLLSLALSLGVVSAETRVQKLFKNNCMACHGIDGHPTAVGKALRARDLLNDPYRQGESVEQIAKTLLTGVPGTGMAKFDYLSEADRLALARYVVFLRQGGEPEKAVAQKVPQIQTPEPKAPVVVAPKPAVTPEVSEPVVAAPKVVRPVVVTVPEPVEEVGFQVDIAAALRGKKIYDMQCALCHGPDGKAQTPTGMAMKARNLVEDPYKQGDDFDGIMKTLANGVAGTAMASFAHIPESDRKDIAHYVLALRLGTDLTAAPAKAKAPASEVKTVVPAKVEPKTTVTPVAPKASGIDPLIAKGRDLYRSNACNSCHGDSGLADTPTGMALKARNFQKDEYKNGATVAGIVKTLQEGLGGTAMAAYPHIPDADKKAIASFLLALKDNPDVAKTPKPVVKGGQGKVSLSYAMDLVAKGERYPIDIDFVNNSKGAQVYMENCASCHGDQGQGGVATRFISAAPYYRVKTSPLLGHKGDWLDSKAKLTKIVVEGLPGKLMPGMGTLTQAEMDALYDFMKACRAQAQEQE